MIARTLRRSRRRAMTLVEVLVAISIVLIMSMVGWATVQGAVELNDVLAEGDAATRGARAALGRLRRELALAYLTPNRTLVNTYRTVFVGQNDDPDTLWFATLAHRRLYRNSRESDQAEVSVWVDDAPDDVSRGDVLFHRESERIDQYPDEDGRIMPLAYDVRSFNLRYLDNRDFEWMDEWDSNGADTPYILPRAVQIGLVLLRPDPDDPDRSVEVPALTTVVVEAADPIQPLTGNGLNAIGTSTGATVR